MQELAHKLRRGTLLITKPLKATEIKVYKWGIVKQN